MDMVNTAVILAGGLGTRLRSISGDLPKPMVDVCGVPFLSHVLDKIADSDITKVYLSVCYNSHYIKTYFNGNYKHLEIAYSEDQELLGTGGSINSAIKLFSDQEFLVINGDTIIDCEIRSVLESHAESHCDATVVVKYLEGIERYGEVSLDGDGNVLQFFSKSNNENGFINSGMYVLNRKLFSGFASDSNFALESGVIAPIKSGSVNAYIAKGYFIDIGVPEDYELYISRLSSK